MLDPPGEKAARALTVQVSRLRKALGSIDGSEPRLVASPPGYGFGTTLLEELLEIGSTDPHTPTHVNRRELALVDPAPDGLLVQLKQLSHLRNRQELIVEQPHQSRASGDPPGPRPTTTAMRCTVLRACNPPFPPPSHCEGGRSAGAMFRGWTCLPEVYCRMEPPLSVGWEKLRTTPRPTGFSATCAASGSGSSAARTSSVRTVGPSRATGIRFGSRWARRCARVTSAKNGRRWPKIALASGGSGWEARRSEESTTFGLGRGSRSRPVRRTWCMSCIQLSMARLIRQRSHGPRIGLSGGVAQLVGTSGGLSFRLAPLVTGARGAHELGAH
jgi:hypothetical protein